MYNLIKDGMSITNDVDKFMSDGDEDLEVFWSYICDLACGSLIPQAANIGATGTYYNESEIDQLKDNYDSIREKQYLKDVFGDQPRLENEIWLKKMTREGKWVFDSV